MPFRVVRSAPLFEDNYERSATGASANYEVSRDGQSFIMGTEPGLTDGDRSGSETVLVLNWHEELESHVPVP